MPSNIRSICGVFFWTKVAFALMISLVIVCMQGYLVYYSHNNAKSISSFINSPDEIPYLSSARASKCNALGTTARLEPEAGQFLWGMSVQWDVDDAIRITNRLGKTMPIFNTFLKVNNTNHEVDILNWQAQQAQRLGAMLQVSVFPTIPVGDLTNLALYKMAAHMRRLNSYYGVPVYMRFGPEMNGEWMEYHGLRPTAFKEKFRILATYIRSLTNLTAMVWAPNIAGGTYSFGPTFRHVYPAQGSEDFRALDTNGNGAIENTDNSYDAYYPGDEYVDWVALSVYNYARSSTGNQGPASPDRLILEMNKADFYSKYVRNKKPFMLAETGASTDTNIPGGTQRISAPHTPQEEETVKRSWLNAVVNAMAEFPEFKAAVWFEEKKPESVGGIELMRDFRILTNAALVQTFLRSIATSRRVNVFVDGTVKKEVYSCSGALNF